MLARGTLSDVMHQTSKGLFAAHEMNSTHHFYDRPTKRLLVMSTVQRVRVTTYFVLIRYRQLDHFRSDTAANGVA